MVKRNPGKGKSLPVSEDRLRIGLIIGWLVERYQAGIWPGAADAAAAVGADLVCFVGGALSSPYGYDVQRNTVYDLATPDSLDGLVVIAGSVGNFIGDKATKAFCDRFKPLPCVSVALALEGIPSVVTDNTVGMKELVEHLIGVHGYRRPAFISGPAGHQEAEERFEVYRQVLMAHDLPVREELIAPGDFSRQSGIRAVEILVDERKVQFDALVAANDGMALGAFEALRLRGVTVPNDVALVGFDDLDEVKYIDCPLTTVKQNMYEQGKTAVEILLAVLRGEEVPARFIMPSKLVVRQSCGCSANQVVTAALAPAMETVSVDKERDLATALRQAAGEMPARSPWFGRLTAEFSAALQTRSPLAFLGLIRERLLESAPCGKEAADLVESVLSLRRSAAPLLSGDDLLYAENLWHQAQVMAWETARQTVARQRLDAEGLAEALVNMAQDLITIVEMPGLFEALGRWLPLFGIQSSRLVLCDPDNPDRFELVMSYDADQGVRTVPRRFPAGRLLPAEQWPKGGGHVFIVEPLSSFSRDQLGHVIFQMGLRDGSLYQILGEQISAAIKGARLFQERKWAEESLAKQTAELARSNAELEQFAYIASHDLQEPLRMISSYLQLLARRYMGRLDKDADDLIALAVDGAHRMRQLITDLLIYSRVTTRGRPPAPVDSGGVLAAVRKELAAVIKETGATVTGRDLPVVLADETQLLQLMRNLIDNALKFRGSDPPKIEVTAARSGDRWVFAVADNGIGIAPEDHDRVFQMFQRPHSMADYPGTDIGLAVCERIVERHGGRIWVESSPGQGTVFRFTLSALETEAPEAE